MLGPEGQASYGVTLYQWMSAGSLSVDVRFVLDHLSIIMTLVITGVGFLIHVYSAGYMSHDPSFARYFTYLNLFCFSMLILVLGDSLPLMFVGWEGVGLCSYLLIGFWFTDNAKASAGKKAFVTNRIGDFGFIVAMAMLFSATDTLTFDGLKGVAAGGNLDAFLVTGVCLMLFLGAAGKSAQLPLYVWLPDAMAGPTPVSALIHAATMVTAGVYMVARMGFLFSLAPIAMMVVATVGALTALFAATIGTAQNDIKKVLAYSTVSQLGFMFIAAGVGAYAVAIFHVVTHAFFKACLFLGSGSVIHGMGGEQDMRKMGGLKKAMPITYWTFLISTLAITGVPIPLLSGFISKDAILWNAYIAAEGTYGSTFGGGFAFFLWATGVVAAAFTAFYMWRLVFMTFHSGDIRADEKTASHVHESPLSMTIPLMVLAGLAVFGGALGWPHIFGGHDWIVGWLSGLGASPVPSGDHTQLEIVLMACSLGAAFGGFALAYKLYAGRISPALDRLTGPEGALQWLHARVEGKWHVDEFYQATVLGPLDWISRNVLFNIMDRRIIDGLVNLTGNIVKTIGWFGQLFHTGNIQRYLAVFVIALAILLYGWLTPLSLDDDSQAQAEHGKAPIAHVGGAR
jgi:NADH-quinone oxidoreductase subunit L